MGQVTPNIGIYIPAAGETNYDSSFAAGMVNIDQHDHSGGPNKGVPIATAGIADGSITFAKLNANVADTSTGIGTASGASANQLQILGLLKNIYQLATSTGFLAKNGSTAFARTIQQTANQTTVTNGDGASADPVIGLAAVPQVAGISFNGGVNTLANYVDSGTFTPGISFGGASTGITYAFQNGYYTRIGNIVFYTISIKLSSLGSATGQARVTGFPITQGATVPNRNFLTTANVTLDVNYTSTFLTSELGTTNMLIDEMGSGQVNFTILNTYFAVDSLIRGNGFYIIA